MANIKQTAGHDALGEFAPEFAHLNDDVLFGEVWNREGLSPKLRSIVTVSALIGKDITDSSPQAPPGLHPRQRRDSDRDGRAPDPHLLESCLTS